MIDPKYVLFLRIFILLISLPIFFMSFLLIFRRISEKGFSFSYFEVIIILLPFLGTGAGTFASCKGIIAGSSLNSTEIIADCISVSVPVLIIIIFYKIAEI